MTQSNEQGGDTQEDLIKFITDPKMIERTIESIMEKRLKVLEPDTFDDKLDRILKCEYCGGDGYFYWDGWDEVPRVKQDPCFCFETKKAIRTLVLEEIIGVEHRFISDIPAIEEVIREDLRAEQRKKLEGTHGTK